MDYTATIFVEQGNGRLLDTVAVEWHGTIRFLHSDPKRSPIVTRRTLLKIECGIRLARTWDVYQGNVAATFEHSPNYHVS
jgi:hypothetical protein